MSARASLGELLLGTEGLALLRLAFADDAAARRARVSEMRSLLERLDDTPELAAPLAAPEYDLDDGYGLWSETYDQPLRLFPIEQPAMCALLDPLAPSRVLDAACGTGRYSAHLAARGHEVVGVDRSAVMLARARQAAAKHIRGRRPRGAALGGRVGRCGGLRARSGASARSRQRSG